MACLAHYLNFFPQLLQDFDDSLPSQSQLSIPPPKGFEVLPLYLSVKWKLQKFEKYRLSAEGKVSVDRRFCFS